MAAAAGGLIVTVAVELQSVSVEFATQLPLVEVIVAVLVAVPLVEVVVGALTVSV